MSDQEPTRRPSPGPTQTAAGQEVGTESQGRRPSPGGSASPTSRARRASGATVDGARRRPSPGPTVATAPAEPVVELTKPEPAAAETPPEPEAQPAERRRGAPIWVAALLVLVIAGLATLSWVLYSSKSDGGSTTERDQALSAAKSSVPVILTYSYKEFSKDVAAGKTKLTGRASTDYVTAMTKSIEPTATKVKAVVSAQTDGAGVESVSSDGKQVTVIVFGEQKVTNTSLSAPRTDIFRVRATLNLVGKQWLVSKFDQI